MKRVFCAGLALGCVFWLPSAFAASLPLQENVAGSFVQGPQPVRAVDPEASATCEITASEPKKSTSSGKKKSAGGAQDKQATCQKLRNDINKLDARARKGQSAKGMARIQEQRRGKSDQMHRLGCRRP